MNKPVKVKMKTTIRQPNEEPEVFELWAAGFLIEKNRQFYLKYEEVQDDKKINTTVKMGDTEALVMRSGGLNMRLPFVVDAEQTGRHESEYGVMMVTTATRAMSFERKGDSGQFTVRYDLNVSGEPVGEYTLEFNYTEGS